MKRFALGLGIAALIVAGLGARSLTSAPTTSAVGSPTMTVSSTAVAVGANATVTITLANVPLQTGYSFDMAYTAGLTRQAGTTSSCIDGETGVPPTATGPSPYSAGCTNIPSPGTANADCATSCTLATVILSCDVAGSYTLDISTAGPTYADAAGANVSVTAVNGNVTCPAPTPTSTITITPTDTATATFTATPCTSAGTPVTCPTATATSSPTATTASSTRNRTNTPTVTKTVIATATATTGAARTATRPAGVAPTQPSGGAGAGGTVRLPNTGSQPAGGSGTHSWLWLTMAALAAAGIGGAMALTARRHRR